MQSCILFKKLLVQSCRFWEHFHKKSQLYAIKYVSCITRLNISKMIGVYYILVLIRRMQYLKILKRPIFGIYF